MKGVFKKKYRIWIILTIAFILCLVSVRSCFFTKRPLQREKDTEFNQGSTIQNQELSDIQVDSLYKLCKVWGYTKYHHPAVISGELNWDAELFRVMPNILKAADSEDANEVLMNWLEAFPVKATQTEDREDWTKIQKETGRQILDTTWINDSAFLGEGLRDYLCSMSELYISDRENAYASFNEEGVVSFENEMDYEAADGDMGMYLLGLFRFWNMYEYYSPNVEITVDDWDTVLLDSISLVAEATDYRSYVLAIAQVVSKTGDAHITVVDQEGLLYYFYGRYFLPCDIKIIDGQAVVTQVKEGEKHLLPGDILLTIDGMSVQDRIKEQRQYHALPEPDKILNQLKHLLLETQKNQSEVQVIRGEETKTLQVKTLYSQYDYQNPLENEILESTNIGYIDVSALKTGDLENLMKDYQNTDGIIVDLRHYPSTVITYLLGEYIVPTQKVFSNVGMPNRAMPGAFWIQEMVVGKGVLKEQMNDIRIFKPYTGKVVILMDEGSQSQSEFAIMALRQAPNATVVGNPSIGADGNIAMVSLPGRVILPISSLGIYTPEGGQTQRLGLKPDIECYPTLEGIRDGRDELLEQAIEVIL